MAKYEYKTKTTLTYIDERLPRTGNNFCIPQEECLDLEISTTVWDMDQNEWELYSHQFNIHKSTSEKTEIIHWFVFRRIINS